ncbi:hypothetical protein Pcinc_019359 [Petrolisthes cinctipes]|uniref:Integrase p58-like C-terminal domain-containing protein n=1 Tax=Petrolisthes cinctipes TaxID=88211 RepID=A0AAE1FLN9_PETCI|nr:hypothetical protein Pcinc_019359 [Petrolisthes cinctipes]
MYTIILTTAYSSNLTAFIIIHRDPPGMQTIKELYQAKVTVLGLGEYFRYNMLQSNNIYVKYKGPYKVVRQVGDTDYLIATPDHRKFRQLCHNNMLKPYVRKGELPTNGTVAVVHGSEVMKSESMSQEMVGSESGIERGCGLD